MTEVSAAGRLMMAALCGGGAQYDTTDVWGICLQLSGGEPMIFVELAIGDATGLVSVNGELVEVDVMNQTIQQLGMRPTRNLYHAPEPPDGVQFVVRRNGTDRKPSGVFGPGIDGEPCAWTLIDPLPPWPTEFDVNVPANGHQIGVYATVATTGMSKLGGLALLRALHDEGRAGRLYGARAAVL